MAYSVDQIGKFVAAYCSSGLSIKQFCANNGISTFAFSSWLNGQLPSKKPRAIYQPMDVKLERELLQWHDAERAEKRAVWRADIRAKALEIAVRRGHKNFKVSDGWITKWLKRHRLSLRQKTRASRKLEITKEDEV